MQRKWLLGATFAFNAVVAVLLIAIVTRPSTMHIERSTTIDAPADVIYPHIADFHQWPQWSPFEKVDPGMARTYDGATAGKGAKYAWKGNKDAGEGTMTITDTTAPSRVAIDLEFDAPMKASNTATFTLVPDGNGTKVTWAMDGDLGFMAKAASIVMDMDKLVGPDFEHGLADLKAVSEAEQKQHVDDAATAAAATPPADAAIAGAATPAAHP